MDVISNKSFHILLTKLSNKLVKLPKRMSVVHVTDSLAHFIATEAALLEASPETIDAVHYKPSVDKDTQMTHHNDAEAKYDRNFNLSLKSKV